ncbi:AAA family ATPase [Humibacillus xanthopallidus]|uniref:ATPase family protein associated with various cellular activities (AAA) n=1 Tax=Humibacillus xanthopallidus TaxID=412689 RepID=A0A543I1M8_9MICO|nr:AAA family ATPase [Humibacillus xanthopallidus]TQM64486.1 ATPase family protein associated with various cellular activities (AAA) [Humibacillus xanthopallidus]
MSARSRLAESLDDLSDIAAEAGLDPAAARDEGLRVAAALAESVPGAATEWARVAHPGVTDLGRVNEAFFDAASSARRWRGAPTDLLEALVASRSRLAVEYAEALTEVASSAVMLGTAPIWVIANASVASAAYLDAAQGGALHVPSPPLGAGLSGGPLDGIRQMPAGALGLPDVLRPNLPGLLDPSLGTSRDPRVDPPAAQGDPAAPGAQAAADGATPAPEPEKPAEPEKSVEELLAELDAMIGLARVKKEIHRQVALLTVEKMRTQAGLKAPRMSRHLIFVGNPGTGKTTVARLIGAIYRALELLPQGQLVEVDRSELVAGYVGQTAMKTAEVCARATGGVLFIDEAYALTGDQYAEEAVNTLVKEMEDRREELVVIVAGYPDPMVRFIGQNPGLASRFTTTIEFDDYTDEELLAILDSIAAGSDYELTPEARTRVGHILQATPRTSAFGNGRFSRNLFEQAVGRHAWRLKDATEPTRDDLRLLTADDFTEQPDEPVETEVLEPPDATDPAPIRADPDGPEPVDEAVSDEQTATSEDTR